jgi:hypothetical protein
MRQKAIFFTLLFLTSMILIQGCKDHEVPDPVNEEELITTLTLSFRKWDETGQPAGDPLEYSWRDVDASGNPEIDAVVLEPNSTYTMNISVLDESKTPVEVITDEIIAEAEDHQFFFVIQSADISIDYEDLDGRGNPVGLQNIVTTNGIGSGTLTVILRHEPDKDAEGVSSGNIANASGETDIQTDFPLMISE